MQRFLVILGVVAAITWSPRGVWAQADAQQEYQAARAAFAAGEFEKARDHLMTASQTDAKNPEIFLLLGKAQYQLGRVEQAVAAWDETLRLAPKEPYAAKMLESLRGQAADADVRIALVETMIGQGLLDPALTEADRILSGKALTGAQRAKATTLKADVLLRKGLVSDAQAVIQRLLATDPKNADPAAATLLLGQAKLRAGGDETADGLALLEKVVVEHKGTPAAATARFELLSLAIRQTPTADNAKALADWIDANTAHPWLREARRILIDAYLAVTDRSAPPAEDAPLAESDKAALSVAGQLGQTAGAGSAEALIARLVKHFEKHYAARKAYAAAAVGAQMILESPLASPGSPGRREALRALGRYRAESALATLARRAESDQLAPGPLPESLAAVLATLATVNREFPAEPAWADQAALAGRVRQLSAMLPAAVHPEQVPAPSEWAVEIALPVVRAGADGPVTAEALKTIKTVLAEAAALKREDVATIALSINTRLLDSLSSNHAAWQETMLRQANLLDRVSLKEFNDHLKAGEDDKNDALSDSQKELLATLGRLVERRASTADAVAAKFDEHLKPWLRRGHFQAAEQAYAALEPKLTEARRRRSQLAVVNLWIQEVYREHARLQAAGLTVPRALNPTLAKALKRLCNLQAGVDASDPYLQEVRSAWKGMVDHYRKLDFFDIAEEAIKTAPDPPVEPAAAWAELQLAHLRFETARRELARLTRRYGGDRRIEITPAFQAAIAAYSKLATDRPTNPLAAEAVAGIFNIAAEFERHAAFKPAARVYGDLAALAATVPPLAQAEPGSAGTAERAAYAVAESLDKEARRVLAETIRRRKPDEKPPEKISDEFTAAIDAYNGFIKDHPKSVLVGPAKDKIMAVALEYARIDAWEVADGIYAGILESHPATRHPERLQFARALCQLGRAMPAHAREVLAAMTSGFGKDSKSDKPDSSGSMLAGIAGGGIVLPRNPSTTSPAALPGASSPADAAAAAERPAGDTESAEEEADLGADSYRAYGDALAMQAIRRQQSLRASRVAMLRDQLAYHATANQTNQPAQQREGQQAQQGAAQAVASQPVLSDAEIERLRTALDETYKALLAIRKEYPQTAAADQARGELLVMVDYWRSLGRWQDAAGLAERFLTDHPTDAELPKIRLEIARDLLGWAAQPVPTQPSKQAMLAEVADRFEKARAALEKVVADFPDDTTYVQQAQWDVATSYLTQARVVAAFSATLARGQYVRAAKQLQSVGDAYHDHPKIGEIPQMLWNIAAELSGRGYHEEAIVVWNDSVIRYPTGALSQQAARRIAETYDGRLDRPLKAVEVYQELNFAGGGAQDVQDAIFAIGVRLKEKRRWVEALHVLESFVDTFPHHAKAGDALTLIGQIHQANEVWEDAIAAYRRVISEFEQGEFVKSAKWSIAECTINLSRWQEAIDAYRDYIKAYPQDANAKTAAARIDLLKDLVVYQTFVDEDGKRKADDAQFEIAHIVQTQLGNPVKAIIEYRKVRQRWPQSHLADDALYNVGSTYLALGETEKARKALLAAAEQYPGSPLADDALFLVGKSYEDESQKLSTVTRAESLTRANEMAQRSAYEQSQGNRRQQRDFQKARASQLRKSGKKEAAENYEAFQAAQSGQFDIANTSLFAEQAKQDIEKLTAAQLADRQDKINAALRKAVAAYRSASQVAEGDKADKALLRMAQIYDEQLKDSEAAVTTWLEIVRQFSGTTVAEDASWRIAQYYERTKQHAKAIEAYKGFLRNYRRSPNAGAAQAAIAENYEKLNEWISAMDAYTNYLNNFPEGPAAQKARARISWIKTYRL